MNPATRCTPHGAYFCERCHDTADDHRDILAALVTLRELTTRVTELERRLNPSGAALVTLRELTTRVTELERRLNPSGCDHRLGELRCILDTHLGNGHVYTSSQTGDRHRDD